MHLDLSHTATRSHSCNSRVQTLRHNLCGLLETPYLLYLLIQVTSGLVTLSVYMEYAVKTPEGQVFGSRHIVTQTKMVAQSTGTKCDL